MNIKDIDYRILQNFFNSRSCKGIETNKSIKKSLNRVYEYALNPNRKFSIADLKLKRNNTEYILSEIFPIAEDGRFYTQGIELWGSILSELKPYIEINNKKTLDIILSEKMFSKPVFLCFLYKLKTKRR